MRKFWVILAGTMIIAFLASAGGQGLKVQASSAQISSAMGSGSPKVDKDFGKMPLYFIPNQGQVDARVAYYIQGRDKTIYFTSGGVTYVLCKRREEDEGAGKTVSVKEHLLTNPAEREFRSRKDQQRFAVKLDFVGANADVRPSGEEKTGAVISYFKGKPEEWKSGLPTYSRIVYKNLWPGIDLAYHGTVDKMKYEFVVHPGSDPSLIRLAYRGVSVVKVNGEGRLEVRTPVGGFADDRPEGYQEINGDRVDVAMSYLLEEPVAKEPEPGGEEAGTKSYVYGFEVGDYDRTKPLVLDPAVIVYCGYIGGADTDYGYGIAVDGTGNIYVTGSTTSTEATFPVSGGPDLTFNGGSADAFVAKVNASGTALVYCGYIGGLSGDEGNGIAVDGTGNAYVAGKTSSTAATFPVIGGPDLTHNGGSDAFVAKVNASGTALVYCGYIGGAFDEYNNGIAVDGSGNAYVTGKTGSPEATFPVSGGPDLTYNSGSDAFVAKVNASGTGLVYCGYIGGSDWDEGNGIAVNSSGNVYVTGKTSSTAATFPEIIGPDLTHNGNTDAFVAKVNATGTALVYCGYIGGSENDIGRDIAVDGSGNAYVTGGTVSTAATFPVIGGPDLTYNSGSDAFVAKVNASGTALVYCGYIGGSDMDEGFGMAVDSSGNAYVTGATYSTAATFPVISGPDLTHNGNSDAFVAKVNASGTALVYSGYIGGSGDDSGTDIAIDGSRNAFITGMTVSTEATFPVIGGPDLTYNGGRDALVAKISSIQKDDFIGTWDGQGVYYLNSLTSLWVLLASPATLITTGDLEGDGIDDLIGIWPGQGGVWVKYSQSGTWAQLSSTARDISSGDMNGDGRDDLLATWDGQGVYYRNSISGDWVLMATPAEQVTAGDLDGDGKDDLIGIWPSQGGVWVKYSQTGSWAQLSSTAVDIAAGDMNGDCRDDLVATWDGQGVYYKDSIGGAWVLMATPATLVAAGDLDGDGKADVIGIWPGQGGVWVKYSQSGSWAQLSSTARHIAAGLMRGGAGGSATQLADPFGGIAAGPVNLGNQDMVAAGPGDQRFQCQDEKNLTPQYPDVESELQRVPGPGEFGFQCLEQDNLVPGSGITKELQRKE